MKLHEKIKIKLFNENKLILENIIIQMKVISGTKNPYYIHFPKTDLNGISILTKKDFIGQFEDHYEIGLMDYNGTIESANSIVEISLFDPTWMIDNKFNSLAWPLLKNEKLQWNSRDEKYKYMTSSNNLNFYIDPVSIDLNVISLIELNLKKK